MKNLEHLLLRPDVFGKSEKYNAKSGRNFPLPERDRKTHANQLLQEIESIQKSVNQTIDGVQVEFYGQENSYLETKSLESRKQGIYLLNQRNIKVQGKTIPVATVHIPRGKPNAFFADKITEYRDKETKKGNPKNDRLIRSIEKILPATLQSFWYGKNFELPDEKKSIWCEVWLVRPTISKKKRIKTNSVKRNTHAETNEIETPFINICHQLKIDCRKNSLQFPEMEVFLIRANNIQLQDIVDSVAMLSSIAPHRESARFWLETPPREQPEWIDDLRSRLQIEQNPTASVCILDTGINNTHPLLKNIVPDSQCHSVRQDNDVADFPNQNAHGTAMCGIATFGNLNTALETTQQINVNHTIESVKILFEDKENEPELYGNITSQAVSLVEIERPELNRIHCLAITAEGQTDGSPSSWSATLDQLAFGDDEIDNNNNNNNVQKRLFVVSAGNVQNADDWIHYPDSNDTASIEEPAQSWNALTVGAYTNKTEITESGTENYSPIASAGNLSPISRTSVSWDNRWTLKPDIVLEGGNIAKSPQGETFDDESLSVLTTSHDWATQGNHFTPFRGTSPATAEAAWIAAQIYHSYPQFWAETVRGLVVHSARWTDTMIGSVSPQKMKKEDIQHLLRTVGFGVPQLSRAITSVNNNVTMIIQDDRLQPFIEEKSTLKFNTFRLFELPIPQSVLRELEDVLAEIHITLSYFISPSPGHRGWDNRYRYPSCTLKFDLNNINEDRDAFVKRLNAKMKEEGENNTNNERNDSGSDRWIIGKNLRHRGSIHTDFWQGNAVDMVNCRYLAVYPSGGWWKERPQLGYGENKIRFSLIVSLNLSESIDIYTPIAQKIEAITAIKSPATITVPH